MKEYPTKNRIKLKQGNILKSQLAVTQRIAHLHPGSPSLLVEAMIADGRLRTLDERKATPIWKWPKE